MKIAVYLLASSSAGAWMVTVLVTIVRAIDNEGLLAYKRHKYFF